jgi:hypothetical protein
MTPNQRENLAVAAAGFLFLVCCLAGLGFLFWLYFGAP